MKIKRRWRRLAGVEKKQEDLKGVVFSSNIVYVSISVCKSKCKDVSNGVFLFVSVASSSSRLKIL